MINPDHKEKRYLVPQQGELRYVERQSESGALRILQQYQWSHTLAGFHWFDINLEAEV